MVHVLRPMKFYRPVAGLLFALALSSGVVSGAENPEVAAQIIVESEAKFYQMGQEQGTRAAFLQFLADDAIVFQPAPTNGKAAWKKRPEKGISLTWKPLFVAMSRSADLGYSTGPAEWRREKTDEKPFGYGQFVSIWRKQKDGTWKVALDVGSEVPGILKTDEAPQLEISLSPDPAPPTAPEQAGALKKLHEAEAKFAAAARQDSTAALLAAASSAVRVHREGVYPAVGEDAAALMLSVRKGQLTTERLGGAMSEAGDLAYSYGRYSLARAEKPERGHYLQIWRTDKYGWWQLWLDYQNPLPPAKQP